MHSKDLTILAFYLAVLLGVGRCFLRQNSGDEDSYVAGPPSWHLQSSLVV